MTKPSYDQAFWERLWAKTQREHPEKLLRRAPSRHLVAELEELRPGRALDAGCGHGVEALWLAARGWQVTALDFSPTALACGRAAADSLGEEVATRLQWCEGDLATWPVPAARYDLVTCLYVHIAGRVEDMVQRVASGVAPGGTLFMLGHRPIDPATGAPTRAAGQVQVSVEAATAALDPSTWEWLVAEERRRELAGSGVDAVLRARRRP